MDNLHDLLRLRHFDPPDEIAAIKAYVAEEFGAKVAVSMQGKTLVITTASAALANALRLRLPALQKVAGDKKIILRIG